MLLESHKINGKFRTISKNLRIYKNCDCCHSWPWTDPSARRICESHLHLRTFSSLLSLLMLYYAGAGIISGANLGGD